MAEEDVRITAARDAIIALWSEYSHPAMKAMYDTPEMREQAGHLTRAALAAVDALEPPARESWLRDLQDYEGRLHGAVASLAELLHEEASDPEIQRLIAKREAVKLALSYLRDFYTQALNEPPAPTACEHHEIGIVYPGTAMESGVYYCKQCAQERPSGRTVHEDDGNVWWESLDWDGRVLARFWRGGPDRRAEVVESSPPKDANNG